MRPPENTRARAPCALMRLRLEACCLALGKIEYRRMCLHTNPHSIAISGACPGMLAAQLGSGVPALATLAGAVAGALIYGLVQPHIAIDGHTLFGAGHKPKTDTCVSLCRLFTHCLRCRLDARLGVSSSVLSAGLVLFICAFVGWTEFAYPWLTDLQGILPETQCVSVLPLACAHCFPI